MDSKDRAVLGTNLASECLFIVPPNPSRYTIADSDFDTLQKNQISQDQQMLADRVLMESQRILEESHSNMDSFKQQSDYRIKERMIDIKFLVDEVMMQKKSACKEEEALKTYRHRIVRAIRFLKEMGVKICQQCIIIRENRLGTDMTNDEVDQELKREIAVISGCQSMLDKVLEETSEQIRRLRATIYLLDRNLASKEKAYMIDEMNLGLKPSNLELSIYEGPIPLKVSNTTQDEWEKITSDTIQNTAKELNSAMPLRSYVDVILKQIVEDISNQVIRTNEAFRTRISEIRYGKKLLEGLHYDTSQKVNDMLQNIRAIENDQSDKEKYLACAQMRLANRAQRPGTEMCQDPAQDALMAELRNLEKDTNRTKLILQQSKATLRYLLQTQMCQEEEINVKTNTLKIDEVDCMTIREGLNFSSF